MYEWEGRTLGVAIRLANVQHEVRKRVSRALALRAAHVSSACCASVATRAAALPAPLPAALAPSWPPWPSLLPARYGASSAACVSKPE